MFFFLKKNVLLGAILGLFLIAMVGCGCDATYLDDGFYLNPEASGVSYYPHPSGWVDCKVHGPLGAADTKTCLSCHDIIESAPSCTSCHSVYPHPDSWQNDHREYVQENGDSSCRGCCHGPNLDGGNSGVSCSDCHSCTSCHSSPKDDGDGDPPGGRREVVGEFDTSSSGHHGDTLESDDCLVCHSQTTHKDGNVDLIDADDNSLYTFQFPADLASDPDLSDFCSSCHDTDGATRLPNPLDPFGTGNPPSDVATKFKGTLQWDEWYGDGCFGEEGTLRQVNSHHDISDADQAFSGAKIECLDCHGGHTASASQPLVDPLDTLEPWFGPINDFCLSCHEGGSGPADPEFPDDIVGPSVALRGIDSCDYGGSPWFVDFDWTHSAHGLDSKRGWAGYSGAPAYDMDCVTCHDPHGSYTATNTEGNPYMIRDYVDGTSFIDDGSRAGGFNGPPWNIFGDALDVMVTISGINVDWGTFCSTCHGDWENAMWAHGFCTSCQTCHSHGSAWGGYDWGPGNDDHTFCP